MNTTLTRQEKVDLLHRDFLERNGSNFTSHRTTGRLGWESGLSEGEAYSSVLVRPKDSADLHKMAYRHACSMVAAMGCPFRVNVRVAPGDGSYTDGKTIVVASDVFDDKGLSAGQKMDVFTGLAVHETSHVLYSDLSGWTRSRIIHTIDNIIEDERIEMLTGQERPGLANFLSATKYYYFGRHEKRMGEREKQNRATRLVNAILAMIRYPSALREEDIEEFANALTEVRDILTPYPATAVDVHDAARKIYDIVKQFMDKKSEEDDSEKRSKKKSSAGSSSPSDAGDGDGQGDEGSEDEEEGGDDEGGNESGSGSSEEEKKSSGKGGGEDEENDEESEGSGKDSEDGSEDEDGSEEEGESSGPDTEDGEDEDGESESGDGSSEDGDDDDDIEDDGFLDDENGEDTDGEDDDEDSGEDGDDRYVPTDEEMEDMLKALIDSLDKDVAEEPCDGVSDGENLSPDRMSEEVKKDRGRLAKVLAGEMEIGENDSNVYFAKDNTPAYKESLNRVRRYIPAMAQALRRNGQDRQSSLRGLREGRLDTNKLAEAVQGVENIYRRDTVSRAGRLTVCILVDESGSMYGEKIKSARDTAVLLREALATVPNVDLYIYGHTTDYSGGGNGVRLDVFQEGSRSGKEKFALGSLCDMNGNVDSKAIRECAARVRARTQDGCLFFVISDGDPCEDPSNVKKAVEDISRNGFTVVSVGIDFVRSVGEMYSNHISLTDMSRLAPELGKVVKKAIMDNSKR